MKERGKSRMAPQSECLVAGGPPTERNTLLVLLFHFLTCDSVYFKNMSPLSQVFVELFPT